MSETVAKIIAIVPAAICGGLVAFVIATTLPNTTENNAPAIQRCVYQILAEQGELVKEGNSIAEHSLELVAEGNPIAINYWREICKRLQ